MNKNNCGDVELSESHPLLSKQQSLSISSEPGVVLLIRLRLIAYLANQLAQTCPPDRVCNVVSEFLLKQYSLTDLKMCADGVNQFPHIDPVAKLTHHRVAGLFDEVLRTKSVNVVSSLPQSVQQAIRCA